MSLDRTTTRTDPARPPVTALTDADVLLIGDDRGALRSVARSVSIDGHRVDVRTADQVLSLVQDLTRPADYQISTIELAVLDGVKSPVDRIAVFRHLRPLEVPVVVVTTVASTEERMLWLELGAEHVIDKSDGRSIADQVRLVLQRPLLNSPNRLLFGPITLIPSTRVLHVDGRRPQQLTRLECCLLEFFLTHPEKVFSRHELLRRVWGFEVGNQSTVTVHVRRLRRKLEAKPSEPQWLVTVRGAGYCFQRARSQVNGSATPR